LSDDEPPSSERAFGKESRQQLLEEYFRTASAVTADTAWRHVYFLLLWIDRTTGLAHCYESDKSQPGRHWYARSLAFHKWVSENLGTGPGDLGMRIDWLFKHASERLAKSLIGHQARRAVLVQQQRARYEGFPQPGEDPAMEALISEELRPWLSKPLSPEAMRRFTQRLSVYLSQENKRKNLLGEGFEDSLAFIIKRLPGAAKLDVRVRAALHELPGFRAPPKGEKARTVDLAIIGPRKRRVLVTSKWSVRADREEQFAAEYRSYASLEDARQDFQYVLVTNEFDAARLSAACESRAQNTNLFSSVVHIHPAGLFAAYGDEGRGAALRLPQHAKGGRLISLETWLNRLIQSK
jgi:hypothetical protein